MNPAELKIKSYQLLIFVNLLLFGAIDRKGCWSGGRWNDVAVSTLVTLGRNKLGRAGDVVKMSAS